MTQPTREVLRVLEVTDEVSREDLLQSIRRLSRIILDRLDTGTQEKMMDQTQARMLGSIALRSLRLWLDAYVSTGRVSRRTAQGIAKIESKLDADAKWVIGERDRIGWTGERESGGCVRGEPDARRSDSTVEDESLGELEDHDGREIGCEIEGALGQNTLLHRRRIERCFTGPSEYGLGTTRQRTRTSREGPDTKDNLEGTTETTTLDTPWSSISGWEEGAEENGQENKEDIAEEKGEEEVAIDFRG